MPPDPQTAFTIRGPFWEAEATILEATFGSGPQAQTAHHFRALFVEAHPEAAGGHSLHLPGTALALVRVRRVRLQPPGQVVTWRRPAGSAPAVKTEAQIRAAIANGSAALLLLQTHPDDVAEGVDNYTCIGGEIALDPPAALNALWAACGVADVDRCRLHASGVSAHGTVAVPWQAERLPAWLMLSVDLPHAADENADAFRLTLEYERMTSDETTALRQAWQNLSRMVNPRHPRNDFPEFTAFPPAPTWATFEISDPLAAPHFYWSLTGWPGGPERTLHLGADEVAVLLTDQRPYPGPDDPDLTSLAHIVPEDIAIERQGDGLTIRVSAGEMPAAAEMLAYAWQRSDGLDTMRADALQVAFDAVQTADYLRRAQNLPTPVLPRDEEGNVLGHPYNPEHEARYENYGAPLLDPPWLWGFMPLEDGWAQLPFANVTERVYIDLDLARPRPLPEARPPNLLRGALYLGNDAPAVLAGHCDEQPWNLALVNAQGVRGTWLLKAGDDGYELDSVALTFARPDLYLNGLLWLSSGAPTLEDALPDLARWTSAVRRVPLRTLDQVDDVFPPLLRLRVTDFAFRLRPTLAGLCSDDAAAPAHASAELDALTMQVEIDEALFQKLIAAQDAAGHAIPPALPPDAFSRHLPLVWRRHPRLPMVQALPLTQNRHAPNYPGASRQLVPYTLATAGDRPTADWRFVLDGANCWPRLAGQAEVAAEWRELFDLPLVSLSLPGLELDPNPGEADKGLPPDGARQLPAQLRFDLPYLDQIYALAQLPKPARSPAETSPLPDAPPPDPPAPLQRETYAAFWRELAEKAGLATADAVDVLRGVGSTAVEHLIEPLRWPVTAGLRLDAYPGGLTLANTTGDAAPLDLTGEAALRGLDGDFVPDGDGMLRRLPAANGGFHVTAGTLAAHPEEDGAYRDQRGLSRSASAAAGLSLIKTPLRFAQTADATRGYELSSLRQPLVLTANGAAWTQFWFRDLPLEAASQRFTWQETRSPEAIEKDTDINDPDAQARDYGFLTGYQWHLGRDLALGGLHFYPLILESVAVQDDVVRQAVIIGRLQLPIDGFHELTDLSNAVRLTFDGQADGSLAMAAAELVGAAGEAQGEWPLALVDGEMTAAPLLTWTAVALAPAGDALIVTGVTLLFHLFDVPWLVALDPLTFPLGTVPSLTIAHDFTEHAAAAVRAESLTLTLDLAAAQAPPAAGDAATPHPCEVSLRVRLGARRPDEDAATTKRLAAFDTRVVFPLVGDDGPRWEDPVLFHDLLIDEAAPTAQLLAKQHTLQFNWTRFGPRAGLPSTIELLPGMTLANAQDEGGATRCADAPGFAVAHFAVTSDGETPAIELQTGFVEALLTCRWGEYLADLTPGATLPLDPPPAAVFGSSAGDVVFAYTSSFPATGADATAWDETLMLNGFVEMRNLISWPQDLRYDADDGLLELPPARAGVLGHRRHSIRVLFNQHEILPSLPVIGDGALLFQLGARPWQFLAVVEHQIAHFDAADGQLTLAGQQRWTAVQEVRLGTTAAFSDWLAPDRSFASPWQGEPQNVVLTAKHDVNQSVRRKANGQEEIVVSLDPSGDIDDPVSEGTHWLGNFNPLASGPNTRGGVYSGFLFEVKDVPRGARIDAADFSVEAVGDFVQDKSMAIRYRVWVENSVDREAFTREQPISTDPGRMLPRKNPPPDVVVAGRWDKSERVELGKLRGLVQRLVNRSDWNPTRSFVAVVVEGTADEAFMRQHNYAIKKEQDVFRYIAGQKAQLALRFRPSEEAATFGPFTGGLRPLLLDELDSLGDAPMLLVEAGAPFWLRRDSARAPQPTDLQFLPNGTQLAALSNPDDYTPVNPTDEPTWQLLAMPFLGRLQAQTQDTTGASALQRDPLLLIDGRLVAGEALPPLALALSNQGNGSAVVFDLSGFESLATRTLARLDASTLQENWLRLQQLIPETQPPSLRSVMAALPNTAARLSRDVALRRMFDALRRHYPPRLPDLTGHDAYELPPLVDDPLLIWRAASLHIMQGVGRARPPHTTPYGWHLPGLHVHQLAGGLSPEEPSATYPAATILPAWQAPDDTLPVGYTVSPYLGLAFRPARTTTGGDIALEVVELLALDTTLKALRPVAGVLRDAPDETPAMRETFLTTWAVETQRRLAPDSPVAVLRMRQVRRAADSSTGEALISTQYAYQLIDVPRAGTLARRTTRVRSAVRRLSFRQGQFSPHPMAANVKAFEIAPPQTVGVQAIYETAAPPRLVEAAESTPDWPWGLSALRVGVQFTRDRQGISGAAQSDGPAPEQLLLWWQSVQFGVQFRPASGDPRPAAGLPSVFRAPAIRSLLPVNAAPPMPALTPDGVTRVETPPADAPPPPFERWQSILPGRLRYLVTGTRPGALFAFRHSLLRQMVAGDVAAGSLLVSGSVPAQHRAPRPVPLPPNRDGGQAFALQPWASHFEPATNALFTSSPADETFLAECGGDPARRVRVRLVTPPQGLLLPEWKGELRFYVDWTPDLLPGEQWRLSLSIDGNGLSAALVAAEADDGYTMPGEYIAQVASADLPLVLAAARQLHIQVERQTQGEDGVFTNPSHFYQVVALPLFPAADEVARLPLEPVFVHFEDPEYNRRLGSATANSTSLFEMKENNDEDVAHELRLSLDRKAYNATSEIAFRYDWDAATVLKSPKAKELTLSYISAAGSSVPLRSWPFTPPDGGDVEPLPGDGQLKIVSLPVIMAAYQATLPAGTAPLLLRAGDRLEVKAKFAGNKEIAVEVDIVDEPVIPAPEAAYALLRRRPDGADMLVEAARFAWNPEAARVELVCPDDVRAAFVRRRAVFHWQDAARPNAGLRHAMQKIAANGSTHWPDL